VIKCKICGEKGSFWKKKQDYDLYCCNTCETVFIYPYIDETKTKALYEYNQKSECEYYLSTMLEDAKTFNARIKILEKYVAEKNRGIFDYGCSVGTFLRAAKDRGWWSMIGFDLNKKALGFSDDDPYIQVSELMPNILLNNIHMSDVIEHVPDPVSLMKQLNEQLIPGGYLVMTTPNIGSLLAKLLGGRWHAIKPPEHLFYFNKKSISILADKSGFDLVDFKWSIRYRRIGKIIEHLAAISFFGKALKKIVPTTIKNWTIPFGVGDEMLVILKTRCD